MYLLFAESLYMNLKVFKILSFFGGERDFSWTQKVPGEQRKTRRKELGRTLPEILQESVKQLTQRKPVERATNLVIHTTPPPQTKPQNVNKYIKHHVKSNYLVVQQKPRLPQKHTTPGNWIFNTAK